MSHKEEFPSRNLPSPPILLISGQHDCGSRVGQRMFAAFWRLGTSCDLHKTSPPAAFAVQEPWHRGQQKRHLRTGHALVNGATIRKEGPPSRIGFLFAIPSNLGHLHLGPPRRSVCRHELGGPRVQCLATQCARWNLFIRTPFLELVLTNGFASSENNPG